ncbi:hypothetical protein Bca4012_041922 [Brassica carinata]
MEKKETKRRIVLVSSSARASSKPSSLQEEDKGCIEWLNMQKPRSVIYVSVETVAKMETKEVLEMAWGLCNSNQPFLWVIRPGSILGSDGLEYDGIRKRIHCETCTADRSILRHPAVGGFWSHCGWNSTLESIVEGVPLILRPFQSEQKINAAYLLSVWEIEIQMEGEVERGNVEGAVKRLIVDEEGAGMRERALVLKEKLITSLRSGDSSYHALDDAELHYLEMNITISLRCSMKKILVSGFNSLFIEKQTKLLASFISNFSMLLNRNKSILNVSIIVLDKVGRLTWRLAMLLKFLSNKIKWIAASNI